MNSSRIDSNPKCDFKTIEPKEEPEPILISEHVGPAECINIDDESDEEITFLGTFTSSIDMSENTQPLNVKEEGTTNKPQQDINHCILGSDVEETSKFQSNIPARGDSQEKIFPTKLHVNSTLPAVEGKSSGKSQYNIHKNTGPSVILSGINRANQTSHANSGSILLEKSVKNDCMNGESTNKTVVDSQEKQTNVSNAVPVIYSAKEKIENPTVVPKSSTNSKNLDSNICLRKAQSSNFNQVVSNVCPPQESNSSWSREVGNTSSSGITSSSPTSSQKVSGVLSAHHMDNNSTTTTQNHRLTPGAQQTFGSKIKQQVRYVTLPAKFLAGKVTKEITGGTSTGSSVIKVVHGCVNKQPVNRNVIKGELPCKVGDKIQKSGCLKVQISDVNGLSKATIVQGGPVVGKPTVTSPKVVFTQNNPNFITKSNSVKDNNSNGPSAPPSMLLLNNQVIKLKGIKQQESLLRDTSVCSSDIQRKKEPPVPIKSPKCGVEQCCQTDNSTKSVVDQSCQTNIYSCLYKNSKLYTFIDDGGKQVELVPVQTVRVAKPPIETDVASPVSSLDNESDTCLEDEITVTDEPTVSNNFVNERRHSPDNVILQTGHIESSASICETEPSTPQNLPRSYQPQNTFQEVLYTDLGLYNCASKSRDDIQTNSFGSQNNDFQNNTYEQENKNTNTVYNHELQMYVPSTQNPEPEPVFKQPAVVSPDIQYSVPNTSPIVNIFNKLIEDIRTCVSSDALGNIPLHQATINNDLVKLKSQCIVLKTIGSNLNHINLAHETALMLAVKVAVDMSDYEAVSFLISEGADQRIADLEGNTPLHYAVKHGCDQLVRVLLTADDADKVTEKFNYDGLTPLHIAAMEGFDDIIKLLVGTTIDINVKDRKNGRTPYFLAVKEKKWTSAQLLKMFGADVYEPNFSDHTPLLVASPEKSLPQPKENEEHVDDPGNVFSTPTEIRFPPVIEKMPDVSLSSQLFGTSEQSFGYVGRNDNGLNPPPQLFSRNEWESNKGEVERSSEAFDAKELYDKYVKIAAKRRSDFQLEEPVVKPKNVSVKKIKLTPPAQIKTINRNFQSKNVAVSSSIEQNQSCESDRCKNDGPSQSHCPPDEGASLRESQYQHMINSKVICSDNKCHKVQGININNDSVTYNKAVLSSSNIIAQEYHFNSYGIRENYGNEQKPIESKIVYKVNKFAKLTCDTAQDERPRGMQINTIKNSGIVKQFPSKKNDLVQDMALNHNKECSFLDNLSESPILEHNVLNSPGDHQRNCQSSSEVNTETNLRSYLEFSIENPINENESSVENKQSENPIGQSSKAHLPKYCQSVSLNNPDTEKPLGEKCNELLRKPQSSIESQEMCQSSCKVINPNSEKKNSIKANHPVNPIGHSSLIYTDVNNQKTQSSSMPEKTLGDASSELLNLPKESHEKCQSHGMHQNCDSEKKNSVEPKQPLNLLCNSLLNHLSRYSTDSLSQGPKITSRKRSSEMLKEGQKNSRLSSESIKPIGGDKKNSVGVKQVISNCCTSLLNENHKNTQSTALHTVTSKERSNEMLRKSHCSKAVDEYCDSNTKLSKELPPLQDFSSEKQSVENMPDHEILENETNCDSGDDNSCFDETSLNIDFGNVKDIIIGNDSFKLNGDNPNKNTSLNLLSKAETEKVQLLFDVFLDDVVNVYKNEENTSSQKINPKLSRYRKRKLVESEVLMNSQSTGHQKTDCTKIMQNTDSTDAAPINSSACKKPVPNSSSVLVNNMRKKLVSLVSCKISNNVALRESTTLSVPEKSQNEEIIEKTVRRSSNSLSTDSKSKFTEEINRPTTSTVPKLPNALSQGNSDTSRKRSLDSVEEKSQETEKKRVGTSNSEATTRAEKDVQSVVSNTLSRRSSRISKKKV